MGIVVGALTVLVLADLLLTFGVIRRLREHGAKLSTWTGAFTREPGLAIGASVPDFVATAAVTHDAVTTHWLHGATSLVAFRSESCATCEEELPEFMETVKAMRARGIQVLTVEAGHDRDGGDTAIPGLAELATVVREPYGGPVQVAFRVGAYPTYYVVGPNGVVTVAERRIRGVTVDASAVTVP